MYSFVLNQWEDAVYDLVLVLFSGNWEFDNCPHFRGLAVGREGECVFPTPGEGECVFPIPGTVVLCGVICLAVSFQLFGHWSLEAFLDDWAHRWSLLSTQLYARFAHYMLHQVCWMDIGCCWRMWILVYVIIRLAACVVAKGANYTKCAFSLPPYILFFICDHCHNRIGPCNIVWACWCVESHESMYILSPRSRFAGCFHHCGIRWVWKPSDLISPVWLADPVEECSFNTLKCISIRIRMHTIPGRMMDWY